MIDFDKLIEVKTDGDEMYLNSLKRQYREYIQFSDLPQLYLNQCINLNKSSSKIKKFNNIVYETISNRFSYVYNVRNFVDTGYLASLAIDTYFIESMKHDTALEPVLYVDTNLLLDDYKKLIGDNYSDDTKSILSHKLVTVKRYVEEATCVIWDKFSMITSSYDRSKLYNLISARTRRNLSNIYFMENASQLLDDAASVELTAVMNIDQLIDLSEQIVEYQGERNKRGQLW